MDHIIGYVTNANNTECFFRQYIPVHRQSQTPFFETVLGPGPINLYIERWMNDVNEQEEQRFLIGWKARDDRRVNEVLLHLYSYQAFAIDLAVLQIGKDDDLLPLRGHTNKLRARAAIQRYGYCYPYIDSPS